MAHVDGGRMRYVSRVRLSIRTLTMVLGTLTLAACSLPPVPTDTFYNLTSGRGSVSVSASQLGGTAEVPPFRAEGIVNGRAIVYRASATEQRQYTYHYWAEPPAVMLQHSLVDALRKGRAFDQVATPEVRADRDYELVGTLRRLEHVIGGGPSKVIVEFDVGLRRVRGNDTLFINTYRTERTASRGVASAVKAMSAAVDEIIGRVLSDIAAVN